LTCQRSGRSSSKGASCGCWYQVVVTVWLTSQIGQPVSSPQFVMVEVHLAQGVSLPSVELLIGRQVEQALRSMTPFCRSLARGLYPVC